MAIDSRIPMGVQPLRIDSPLESAGQVMQLQALQQRGQLGAMQLAQARRAEQDDAATREAFQGAGGDLGKTIAALDQRGLYSQAMKLREAQAKRQKEALEGQKLQGEISAGRLKLQKDIMTTGFADPSDQGVARMGGMLQSHGFPEESVRTIVNDVLAETDPEARKRRIMGFVRSPEDLVALYKPKFETVDDGQTKTVRDLNPLTNPNATQPIQMRTTPGQDLASRDAAASRAVQMRGQNLTNERGLEANRIAAYRAANPNLVPVDGPNGLAGYDPRNNVTVPLGGRPTMQMPGAPGAAPGGLPGAPGMPAQPAPQSPAQGGAPAPPGMAPPGMPQQPMAQAPQPFVSKAQAEAQEGAKKDSLARRNALSAAETVLTNIDRATESTGGWNAGALGWARSFVPGTSARDLEATLLTIKGNLSFDRLQQMRDASKTGGALGSVTERELDMLSSTLASLDIGQSPDQLKRGLSDVEKRYTTIVNNLREMEGLPPLKRGEGTQEVKGKVGRGQPQEAPQQPAPAFTTQRVDKMPMPSAVPPGTEIDLPNGQTMVSDGKNWNRKR